MALRLTYHELQEVMQPRVRCRNESTGVTPLLPALKVTERHQRSSSPSLAPHSSAEPTAAAIMAGGAAGSVGRRSPCDPRVLRALLKTSGTS